MSCKFETVVEELNKAISTPAIRSSKNEAVMALREWVDRANDIVYSTYKAAHRMDKEASIKDKSLDELKEMLSNTENGKEMLETLDGLKELCI